MNPKKFKSVEQCGQRLAWLDLEITKLAATQTKNEYGTPASEKLQSRLNTLLREQKTLQKRREALRTNEFFPNDFPP